MGLMACGGMRTPHQSGAVPARGQASEDATQSVAVETSREIKVDVRQWVTLEWTNEGMRRVSSVLKGAERPSCSGEEPLRTAGEDCQLSKSQSYTSVSLMHRKFYTKSSSAYNCVYLSSVLFSPIVRKKKHYSPLFNIIFSPENTEIHPTQSN